MSFEPHHGRDTTSRHLVLKPDHTGRQTVRERARRTSRTLRPTAAPASSLNQTEMRAPGRRLYVPLPERRLFVGL